MFTANTSHMSGERNCGHRPFEFGTGNMNQSNHARPTWIAGYNPAIITEKTVIASAMRPIVVRQCCRVKNSSAEIKVPACATPTHQMKFTMSKPHITG